MAAFAFDTLRAVRMPTAVGVQEPVAEAVAAVVNDAVTEGKADIACIDRAMARIELIQVTARLDASLRALRFKLKMQRWMLWFIAAMLLLMNGRVFGAY